TASVLRVVAVCICTPVPALTVIGAVELVPLRPASDGWKANYGLWIRLAVMTAIVTLCVVLQTRSFLSGLSITATVVVAIVVCVTATYIATMVYIASCWVFPIPFTITAGVVPYFVSMAVFSALFIGRTKFQQTPQLSKVFTRCVLFISTLKSLVIIYPGYNAAFNAVPDNLQPVLVFVLPVLKVVLKNTVAGLIDDHEDYIPETVAFSVELFNVIYLVTCMQQGRAALTTLIVISLDFATSAFSLWSVHKSSGIMRTHFAAESCNRRDAARGKRNVVTSVALDLLRRPEELLQAKEIDDIRVDSSIAHSVSLLNQAARRHFDAQKAVLVRETLRMLFYWEYVVLVEYVECVIPLMYALYVSVAVHLPTAAHHSDLREMAQRGVASSVGSVVTYASLEILSLVVLSVLLARRFSFSPLFHLAFVLENQMVLLQAKMVTFLLFAMQFQLDHLGADFTFQFRWLHAPATPTANTQS
ncbi:hypothetical protein PybrP1_006582, partial [[Pythium] brassicae (nom. inval.)]